MVDDLMFSILPLILIATVFSLLAYFYVGSKRKDPLEEGKTALFIEQCGGRIEEFNLTIPFVRHAIYDDFILIAYGGKKILLKNEDIENVALKRYLFSKGIRYNHSRSDIPKSIFIWSTKTAKVIRVLSEKGFTVEVKKGLWL